MRLLLSLSVLRNLKPTTTRQVLLEAEVLLPDDLLCQPQQEQQVRDLPSKGHRRLHRGPHQGLSVIHDLQETQWLDRPSRGVASADAYTQL